MDDEVATWANKVASRFDVVCFDLDQCAVRRHSRGRLLRSEISRFASEVSHDFLRAVPALLDRNVGLAIVTHSDLAQHGPSKPRGPEGGGGSGGPDVVVLGDDLVHEVLHRRLPDVAHEFFVVAWNPRSRGSTAEKDRGKRRHLRTVAAFYDAEIGRCALFDDDPTNCSLTDVAGGHFHAFKSDPKYGFRLLDFVDDA